MREPRKLGEPSNNTPLPIGDLCRPRGGLAALGDDQVDLLPINPSEKRAEAIIPCPLVFIEVRLHMKPETLRVRAIISNDSIFAVEVSDNVLDDVHFTCSQWRRGNGS